MRQASLIQEANANFIDYEPSPRPEGRIDDSHLSDVDRIVKRVGLFANNEMPWDHLMTCWLPFKQTGPRERQNWSKRRCMKAIDQAEDEGLIEAMDRIGSRYKLTKAGEERLRVMPI